MPYAVLVDPRAARELEALPSKIRAQVDARILALAENPTPPGMKVLQGPKGHRYHRIRSGEYRILYRVEAQRLVVLVVRVAHRREVYRNLPG